MRGRNFTLYTRPFPASADRQDWPFGRDSAEAKTEPFCTSKATTSKSLRVRTTQNLYSYVHYFVHSRRAA
jgi:hypothetical protein